MTTLYGIKNCDSVKKARKWLESEKIDYHFHDFRVDGLTAANIKHWLKTIPAERLLNKRSTTWKQLPDQIKTDLDCEKIATTLLCKTLLEHPTLIKRPVIEVDTDIIDVGFSADNYAQLFAR